MKRSSEEIINNINPMKSVNKYETRWKQFEDFQKLNAAEFPNEENFLQYFDYLENSKCHSLPLVHFGKFSQKSTININCVSMKSCRNIHVYQCY